MTDARTVTTSVALAERMRIDTKAVVEHLAEQIDLRHEPASPVDGTVEGSFLATVMGDPTMNGADRRTVLGVEAVGDRVVMESLMAATGDTGEQRHTAVYTLVDGQVAALVSRYEDASAPQAPVLRTIGTGFNVGDLACSLAFYQEALGLQESARYEFPGAVEVVLSVPGSDGAAIVLAHHEGAQAPASAADWGRVILAVDDAVVACARAARCGGTIAMPPIEGPGGAQIAMVRDPDGFTLELVQRADLG